MEHWLTWKLTDEGFARIYGGAFSCWPEWCSVAWLTNSQHSQVDGSACHCSACPWPFLHARHCCPFQTAVNLAAIFAHSLADTLLMNKLYCLWFLSQIATQTISLVLSVSKFSTILSQNLTPSPFPSGSSLLSCLSLRSGLSWVQLG